MNDPQRTTDPSHVADSITGTTLRSAGVIAVAFLSLLAGGCGTSETGSGNTVGSAADSTTTEPVDASPQESAESGSPTTFEVEVWADNWAAVYVDGELVGEDSVPITTERSFNAETYTFEATYPFTIAIEARDFKETDSGIEYIGEPNQQMGDGGLIAQVTDTSTGEVVATTGSDWSVLVIQQAPLNTECADDPDPDATCEFESIDAPAGWADADLDTSDWSAATEWSASDVSPKDGYDEIDWADDAALVWGPDLEVDNTILMRLTVQGP